ncbi:hypothetical protein [Geothrix sp. PMB-07]|uniref:hypothetical protein n=1 Tax=Geothrix sp. PMB-07 TaxID=3068640 RepID=UPI002740796C|nr:hypothetical protein [Geothrix sp. PMB-07]WLT30077.1 hypothetical protein Q9293_10145 [Geothrix sp. PMB-07]
MQISETQKQAAKNYADAIEDLMRKSAAQGKPITASEAAHALGITPLGLSLSLERQEANRDLERAKVLEASSKNVSEHRSSFRSIKGAGGGQTQNNDPQRSERMASFRRNPFFFPR